MNARTSPVELTNICVIYDGDRILVENKIGHGICCPGGHVEPGESMEAAVIREMQEETGLTIASPRLRGIKDWSHRSCCPRTRSRRCSQHSYPTA